MRTILGIVVIALATLGADLAHAQTDAQLWLEAGASYRVDKKLGVRALANLRFDENISRLSAAMPEFVARYRVRRWLRLSGAYRLSYERDNDGDMVADHRLNGDIGLRYRVGDVRLGYRTRYQHLLRDGGDRLTWRNRGKASYRLNKRVSPSVAVELFHRLADDQAVEMRKIRLTAGVDVGFKNFEISAFYRVELRLDDDPTPHILGLSYGYEL